jgi:hypothetical protein
MLDRWLVLATGSQLIDELRALPEEQMSLHDALCEVLSLIRHLARAQCEMTGV